jgi:two-component system LytT family sensor kinase
MNGDAPVMGSPGVQRVDRDLVRSAVAGAAIFAVGILVGATLGSASSQSRIPAGAPVDLLRIIGPSTVPLYAGALALPLFLLLARRVPVRARTLPLWIAAVAGGTVLVEAAFMVYTSILFGGGPSPGFIASRFFNTFPALLGAASLAVVLEYAHRVEHARAETAQARAALSEARLDALTGQLRPHFLFNTLQTISTLVHQNPNAAEDVIGRLGELLRASLRHGSSRLVPLHEELRLTEEYLGIARERFGDRHDARIDADPAADNAAVPPFLLQPLVENALRHAVDERRGRGVVVVRTRLADRTLHIEVCDDGSGLQGGVSGAQGVGLANTRARLAVLFDAEAELTVADRAGGGVSVSISLPYAHCA